MRRKELMLKLSATLLRRREALRKTLAVHTNLIAVNDRSVGDSGDAAVDCEQDELDSQLAAVESRELAAIDAALERMRSGLYGRCESCDKSIPVARLQAVPYATLCIGCQREKESHVSEQTGRLHWERVSDELQDDRLSHVNMLDLV